MRVSKPQAHEPIRLVTTRAGHRYRVVLDVGKRPDGRRLQHTETCDTLTKARERVAEVKSAITSGTYTPPNAETVEQLCRRWLDSRRDVRPVTRDGYRSALAPALRYVGARRVQALTVGDVEGLTAWLAREGGKRG